MLFFNRIRTLSLSALTAALLVAPACDDGANYEVVCVDPELPGCDGSPDTLACRRSPVIVIRGKAGGGTKTVIVN